MTQIEKLKAEAERWTAQLKQARLDKAVADYLAYVDEGVHPLAAALDALGTSGNITFPELYRALDATNAIFL